MSTIVYLKVFIHKLRSGLNLVEQARTYLQLPLRQWGAGNVYLLVTRLESVTLSLSSLQKSEFLKLIILIFHVKKLNN